MYDMTCKFTHHIIHYPLSVIMAIKSETSLATEIFGNGVLRIKIVVTI